ncbi:sulfurtransferase TusA family protein [Galenea microaerophila]
MTQTLSTSPQCTVDARGLKCPMPVIKLQQALRALEPGQSVEIFCTDPGAESDLTSWCKVNHHQISAPTQLDEAGTPVWHFLITK